MLLNIIKYFLSKLNYCFTGGVSREIQKLFCEKGENHQQQWVSYYIIMCNSHLA